MCRKLVLLCLLAALTSTSYGVDLVIGDWEDDSGDGWIDWGSKESIAAPASPNDVAAYAFYQTVGVTLHDYSLGVSQAGWGQSLAKQLNAAERAAFMAGNTFTVDFSVAVEPGDPCAAGWTELYEVAMNAAGPGWTAMDGVPACQYYWYTDAAERTTTVVIDYTDFREAITGTDYIEIILVLNTGGGAPPEMYFDNARLSGVPEPTTIALLGLGSLALLRRKR